MTIRVFIPGFDYPIPMQDNGDGTYSPVVMAMPFPPLLEGGLTELIGVNEQVDQNKFAASIGVALGGTYSGEIVQITLISRQAGTPLAPQGTLYLLDADPASAVNDAALTAAEYLTVIARVNVEAADWQGDAAGKIAQPVLGVPIAFHALANLYWVFQLRSATSYNDGAGDDEDLNLNFWYRRES